MFMECPGNRGVIIFAALNYNFVAKKKGCGISLWPSDSALGGLSLMCKAFADHILDNLSPHYT